MKEYKPEDFQLTPEEIAKKIEFQKEMDLLDQLSEALNNEDEEEASRIAPLIKISPSVANTCKTVMGLEFVKRMGYDLSKVVEEFGEEWLEKENDDYVDIEAARQNR